MLDTPPSSRTRRPPLPWGSTNHGRLPHVPPPQGEVAAAGRWRQRPTAEGVRPKQNPSLPPLTRRSPTRNVRAPLPPPLLPLRGISPAPRGGREGRTRQRAARAVLPLSHRRWGRWARPCWPLPGRPRPEGAASSSHRWRGQPPLMSHNPGPWLPSFPWRRSPGHSMVTSGPASAR